MKSLLAKTVRYFAYHKKYLASSHVATHQSDGWLFVIIFLICLFGILMVYDSSVAIAIRDFSNQYYFVREQMKWLVVGFIVMVVCSRIPYRTWFTASLPFLFATIFLLILVFIPHIGVHALGARRWVNLGFTILQPSELAKLTLIMYLSAWFTQKEKGRLSAFLMLIGMVGGLVMLQPDMGTTIILVCIAFTLYFVAGSPKKHMIGIFLLICGGFLMLTVVSPYRMQRLTTYLNPNYDPQGSSYHIKQALLAIGSGGWFGIGVGQSRQKYEYLPEANTDSIFAIIGEETGFVGALGVILIYSLLVWRGFRIARHASDKFGLLLATGITSWFALQTGINLAAMVALVPLTGVPLPFISYGGSSLIILLSAVGILLNVSRYTDS
jgi:cell division protein FtsW